MLSLTSLALGARLIRISLTGLFVFPIHRCPLILRLVI